MKRKIFGILVALVLVLSFSLVTAVPISAADLGNVSAVADNYTAGMTTTYTIAFTTVGEIPGSVPGPVGTITITFPVAADEYDLSTVVEGDVSVTDDGDAYTYTTAVIDNGAGTVTITAGVSAIAVGSVVVVTIADHVKNPTVAGDYTINIETSAPDEGSAGVTVNPGEAVSIAISPDTATITAGASQAYTAVATDAYDNTFEVTTETDFTIDLEAGGIWDANVYTSEFAGVWTVTGAYSGLEDTATLTINPGALASFTIIGTPAGVFAGAAFPSPITVTAYDTWGNIKTDYVGTVTWSSSASASLPAVYTFVGLDAGVHIFPDSEFTLFSAGTHTITVTDGLVSAPSNGITVMPVDVAPLPDTTSPSISDISASNITESGADICWRTNERSTSQVEYWSSPGTLSPLDETMVINHLVHLTDLTPGTAYHYKTMSKDRAGNLAVSDEDTFTTRKAPAAVFSASDLSISPSEVNIGEMVTISVLVANTGNAAGDYVVTIKINDVAEATKEVTVAAGASKEVTFATSRDVADSYSVDVNGLSGSFTVKEEVAPAPPAPPPPAPPPEVKAPINWPVVGGIIAAVVVVGLLIFFLIRRRAV